MTDLESLALLIADLNAQVRALQQENAELREALTAPTEDGFTRLPNGRRVAQTDSGEWAGADGGGWLPGVRATPEDWLTDPEGYTP